MSDLRHLRSLFGFLGALAPVVALVVVLAIASRGYFRRLAVVSSQKAVAEAIRQRGGNIVFGTSGKSDWPPDVKSIDLSSATIDAELMETISQFNVVEQIRLDGAKLQSEDCAQLGKLPQLRSLSLSRADVTDADVARLPLGLTSLSLDETPVTDESMSHVAAMKDLVSLDIADTKVTANGLRLLEPLRSLETLWIDDTCITADSAESLKRMRPQGVDVAVSEGLGRSVHQCLSICDESKIRGHHPDGYLLWEADSAWGHTLAGVVEAVVSEIGLDAEETAELLAALADQANWVPVAPSEPSPASWIGVTSNRPDKGLEIASLDEFVRELQKDLCDLHVVRRFGREKFTADDVPQLLAAIRAAQYEQARFLFGYGTFLLVHHGIDNPAVLAELDRMLRHDDVHVRGTTLVAFGYGGARPFYSRAEWTLSEEAAAFAVPRIVRMCKDRHESVRDCARMVLADIACARPRYAAEVLAVLVDLLDQEGRWHIWNAPRHISRVDIWRVAEVDAEAAISLVPRLREMLKQLDEQLADAPPPSLTDADAPHRAYRERRVSVLVALSATARHSPELAQEIAVEFLSRLRDGLPVGPFAPLLSPDFAETNRMVVIELLRDPNVTNKSELASVARSIRDWQTVEEELTP